MRESISVRQLQLKKKLLAGAAGIAAVAASGAASAQSEAPAEAPKWIPWAQIGGGAGKDTAQGKIDLFAPVWQDMDSLLFVNLGMGTAKHQDTLLNLGVGYRTKINNEWILGISGGFDSTQTDGGNTFNQWSAGIEAMSEDWDIRLNGYLADSDPQAVKGSYALYISGTSIAIMQAQESAYSGFDGEIGYRVFHTDTTDVRVFAGGFSFKPDHFTNTSSGVVFSDRLEKIEGWKARAEVNVFDLDMLGSQSRLTFNGEVAHDDVRGTTNFIGASLRIPLGPTFGEGGQTLDELDRRMVDPRRRQDNVLTNWEYNKPEPVIIYNGTITSEPTNTLYYVDNSAGSGSYADPTTFKDAVQDRGSHNQFVVVTDFDGAVDTESATVLSGDTVVAGGQTFTVRGTTSTKTFTHTFAPGSGTPTLYSSAPGPVITLDSDTNLFGVNIEGPFDVAIYGHNVDDVVIGNVSIDGSAGGNYGIYLVQDSGNGSVLITDSYIGNVAVDGIHAEIDSSAGGTVGLNISLNNSTIANTGDDGVDVQSNASAASVLNAYLGIHDSTISGAGGFLAVMSGTSSGGAVLHQNLVVDPTYLYDATYGVGAFLYANGGSATQNVLLQDLEIYDISVSGVLISAVASNNGTATQHVVLDNVHVDGSDLPIGIYANVGPTGGQIVQTVDMYDVSVTNALYYGISIHATAYSGTNIGHIEQSVSMNDVDVHGFWSTYTYAYYGYYGTYYYTIPYGSHTIDISARAFGPGSTVDQTVIMNNVTVDGGYSGITAEGIAFGGTVNQGIGIYDTSVFGIYGDDISILAGAIYGGVADQTVVLDNVYAGPSYDGNGVYLEAAAVYAGTTTQHVSINDLYTWGNYLSGVRVNAYAYDDGSGYYFYGIPTSVAQYVTISNSSMNFGDWHGVSASATADGPYAATRQDLGIFNSYIIGNAGYGVSASLSATYGASAEQHVALVNDTVNFNGYGYGMGGARFTVYAGDLGFAHQDVYILDSTFDGNANNGIYLSAEAKYAGQVEQNAYIYYSSASNNGGDGLYIKSYAEGYALGYYAYYSHVAQNAIVAYDVFNDNTGNGVHINVYAKYGAQINAFNYLFDVDASYNGASGVAMSTTAYSYKYGYSGALLTFAYSDLYVVDSRASYNSGDGINLTSYARGPNYLISNITIGNTSADYNGGSGLVSDASAVGFYSLNIQYVTIQNSTFDHNGLDGATFNTYQYFGPYSFGAAIQNVNIFYSDFSNNDRTGLTTYVEATGWQGRAENHFQIVGSYFNNNGLDGMAILLDAHDGLYIPGYACTYVQGLYGGCAFTRTTFNIFFSEFDGNYRDGLYVHNVMDYNGASYTKGGRPYYTPSILSVYNDFSNNGRDGLHIENKLYGYSYMYQYVYDYGSSFTHNGGYGINISTDAYSGSVAVQKTVLYYSNVSNNTAGGATINSFANYATVQQLVAAIDSDFKYNAYGSGLQVSGTAYGGDVLYPSVVSQYVYLVGSNFVENGYAYVGPGYVGGAAIGAFAVGPYATAQTEVYALGNAFIANYGGLMVGGFAYDGGATNQTIDSEGNLFAYNFIGEAFLAEGENVGFASQYVYDAYNYFILNAAGLGLVATANYGGNAEQNVTLYEDVAKYNLVGISSNVTAYGYTTGYSLGSYYFSHVTQNVLAYNVTATDNLGDGVYFQTTSRYNGQVNQFVYFYDLNATFNDGSGVHVKTTNNAYSYDGNYVYTTNLYSDLYVIFSDTSHNGVDGITMESHDYGVGYHIQHAQIFGTTSNYNGRAGFVNTANSEGFYSFNAQYVTIAYSNFDHNVEAGAAFTAYDNYGPLSFGLAVQIVGIYGSTFNYNATGLYASVEATGIQGRAEQYFTIQGSSFNHNTGNGLTFMRYAHDGSSEPGHGCETVQGLYGSCAIVRQTVSFAFGSEASYNGGDGIYIYSHAKNAGAIYATAGHGSAPGLNVYLADISHNGGDGISLESNVEHASYLSQFLYVGGSTITNNTANGINATSYVSAASNMVQRLVVYGYYAPVDITDNGASGIYVSMSAYDAGCCTKANVTTYVLFANIDNNYDAGINLNVSAYGGATAEADTIALYNYITDNFVGVSGFTHGPGATMYNYVYGNVIANHFIGSFGYAYGGSYQYWDFNPGNTTFGNFFDYYFGWDGLSGIGVNY